VLRLILVRVPHPLRHRPKEETRNVVAEADDPLLAAARALPAVRRCRALPLVGDRLAPCMAPVGLGALLLGRDTVPRGTLGVVAARLGAMLRMMVGPPTLVVLGGAASAASAVVRRLVVLR
jgi:hypothetical protein